MLVYMYIFYIVCGVSLQMILFSIYAKRVLSTCNIEGGGGVCVCDGWGVGGGWGGVGEPLLCMQFLVCRSSQEWRQEREMIV